MKRTKFSKACVVALGLVLGLGWAASVSAQNAKVKKKPSDRTVRVIMGWAFAAMPEKVKTREGKEIALDLSDSSKFMIPVDDARRVIRVAIRSTNAERCGLQKLQVQNFRKMMAKEKALGKWSSNQIRFIHRLHVAAGLVMTGDFKAGKDAKTKDENKDKAPKKFTCPPEEQARVTAAVGAYLLEPDKTQ